MPNYCDNGLRIKFNKKEKLEEFLAKHFREGDYGKRFDFDTIIPEPRSKDGVEPKYLANENSHIQSVEGRKWFNWYEWHCDKWGTKWNACDTSDPVITDGLTLCFSYETAWSPSEPIIEKLAEMYDFDFTYTYYECGMGFAGKWTRTNGVIEKEEVDCDSDDFEYCQFLLDNELEEQEYLEELGYIIKDEKIIDYKEEE